MLKKRVKILLDIKNVKKYTSNTLIECIKKDIEKNEDCKVVEIKNVSWNAYLGGKD